MFFLLFAVVGCTLMMFFMMRGMRGDQGSHVRHMPEQDQDLAEDAEAKAPRG